MKWNFWKPYKRFTSTRLVFWHSWFMTTRQFNILCVIRFKVCLLLLVVVVVAESWARSLSGRILWHYKDEFDTITRQETSGDWDSVAQIQVQWQKRRLENDYIYCGLCRAKSLRLPCQLHQTISHELMKRLADREKQQQSRWHVISQAPAPTRARPRSGGGGGGVQVNDAADHSRTADKHKLIVVMLYLF